MARSDAEQEAREQLALAARSLNRIGVYSLAGHISLRIAGSPNIAITPGGGLDKSRMTADDITIIDPSGRRVAGPFPPPLETPIHTIVHAARPDLDSVAHLHAHWSTVFSVLDRPMDIVLLPATDLGPHIPWFEEPRLVTTDDLGRQLNTALGEAAAVLMRWHGITVVGDTVDQMCERAMFLEENARVVYEASTMGRVIPVPSKGFEYMNENREGRRPGARTFNYFANLERGGGGGQIHEGRSSRER